MKYLLDTNICIYAIKQRPEQVLRAFIAHEAEGLGISSVTAGELYFGVSKTGSARNLRALKQLLSALHIAPFDEAAAEVFGSLRAWLEAQGTPIGPYDTQIAAHAHVLGVTLVTNNTREFARVPGLHLENWALPG